MVGTLMISFLWMMTDGIHGLFEDVIRAYQPISENALICGGQPFTCRKKIVDTIQYPRFFSTARLPIRRFFIAFPLLVDKL